MALSDIYSAVCKHSAVFTERSASGSGHNRKNKDEGNSLQETRQPYAGLVLNGVKTVESRWRPLLEEMQTSTIAVHIAQRDWEGDEWRNILTEKLAMNHHEVQELLESGERFGRGVIAGLVDVEETWLCSEDIPLQQTRELEKAACLTGLGQKYLTRLSNPRWLTKPLYSRGHKDIWRVKIPLHLLSSSAVVKVL